MLETTNVHEILHVRIRGSIVELANQWGTCCPMVCQITVHSSIDKYKQEWSQARESTFCCWRNLYFFDFVVYLHQITSGRGKKKKQQNIFSRWWLEKKRHVELERVIPLKWWNGKNVMSGPMVHTSSSGVLAPGLSAQTNNKKVKTRHFPTPKDTFCLVHSKEVPF